MIDPADVGALEYALEQNKVSVKEQNWFPFVYFFNLFKLIDNV